MGFGDALNSRVYDVNQPYGFGAAATRQKQKKPEEPTSPTLAAASTNENLERRLGNAGIEIPTQKPKENLLTKALDILDRPGAAVRGAVYQAYKGGGAADAWESAKKGFTGQEKVHGSDIVDVAAERGAPFARSIKNTDSKAGRFIGNLAVDIATDPLTFVTGGTARVAQTGGKGFASVVGKEVARETGKKLAPESVARLAENAARGEVPVGRLGTAVSRAMGYTAETKPITTGFGKLAQTEQRIEKAQEAKGFAAAAAQAKGKAEALRQEAQGLRKAPEQIPESPIYEAVKSPVDRTGALPGIKPPIQKTPAEVTDKIANLQQQTARQGIIAKQFGAKAKETKKSIKDIRVAPTVGNVSSVTGTPGKSITTLRFMGKPFLNVTPVRTVLGAVIEKSATATKVKDALGRVFSFNYTPAAIKGVERALVTGAKERITQATREIPFAREKAMREVGQQWKGTTQEAAEMAPHVIEETAQGTVEGRRAAEKAASMFDYDAQKFAAEGIPLNTIDKYVQHLYTDPPEKVKAVIDRWRAGAAGRQAVGARPSFTKQRSIPTLEEAKSLGLTPIEDARQLTMIHRALTEQAVVLQTMGRDLIKMGRGVIQNANPGGWVSVTDSAIPALQGKWIHPEVAKGLANLYPIISNSDEGIRLATKSVDSVIRAWKALVLFRPAFHIRNFIGNVFLNIADGVGNPMRYPQAVAVLTEALPFVEVAGRQVPTKVVKEWFGREALTGQGMFMEAAGTQTVTQEAARMLGALQRSGVQSVAYWSKHPFEASRKLGENTDSVGRMANFLHHLDNGLSPSQAAQRTRAALFDYGALTPAEQQIRRWVMPFYAWTRNALPRMTERLVGAPGLFTGATHLRENAVSINEVDERNMPEWLRENQAIPLWVDDKGQVHYLTLNLPLTELSRIHEVQDVRGNFNELVSMGNPIFTTLAQLAMNRNFLTDQKITEYDKIGGLPMAKDYGMFALQQGGPVREIASQIRASGEERKNAQAEAKNKMVEIPPTERGLLEYVGMGTAQNPARWARAAQYQRKEQLMQAKKAAELQGIKVPESKDLPGLAEKKGFGDAASRGMGFGAAGQQRTLREAGDPPTVVKSAMDRAGVDPSWGPYLKMLMQAESGGNPMEVNKLWVNYNTGETSNRREGSNWHQATGLFQMMKPTFEQHKVPGHDDIFNPLDNTLAAINYIKGKYGHPSKIPGLGQPGYPGY